MKACEIGNINEVQRILGETPNINAVDALMQCSLLVNADLSTECVLRHIMEEAKALVGAEVASAFLVDHARGELFSTVNSTGSEIRIPLAVGIAGHVATTGETVIINDAYADARFNKAVDRKTGLKTRNILCAPLTVKKGSVIGVVQRINTTSSGATALDGCGACRAVQGASALPGLDELEEPLDEELLALESLRSWTAAPSHFLLRARQ